MMQFSAPSIDVKRMTLGLAADWQRDLMAECRQQRSLSPAVFTYLRSRGILERCVFLASMEARTPLLFRYLGGSTLRVLGRRWGESVLNQPEDADPHSEFAHYIGLQYAEAIEGGEALVNRISVAGVGHPFVYTQALFGWEDSGRRAVLSAVEVHTLH